MKKHSVQPGESLATIAKHYGFGSTQPLEEHPDNALVLAEGLGVGDELTIPDGTEGESLHGTGRGHEIRVRQLPAAFEIRLYTALHKENPAAPGDKSLRTQEGTWEPIFTKAGAQPIRQIRANVEIKLVEGIPAAPSGGTSDIKTGIFSTTRLIDGTYSISIRPFYDAELSKGPARGDATADHGRGFHASSTKIGTNDSEGHAVPPPAKPFPANGNFELEYRPLAIEVEVKDFTIVRARFSKPPPPSRPHHAVLFWKNCEDAQGKQVLEVDWKPDFLRRIVGDLRPRHRMRESAIDVVMFHHTAGTNIGSALFTFTAKKITSGAHFLVDLDGHVIRMCDDRYETKHHDVIEADQGAVDDFERALVREDHWMAAKADEASADHGVVHDHVPSGVDEDRRESSTAIEEELAGINDRTRPHGRSAAPDPAPRRRGLARWRPSRRHTDPRRKIPIPRPPHNRSPDDTRAPQQGRACRPTRSLPRIRLRRCLPSRWTRTPLGNPPAHFRRFGRRG
ncbi:hypothetical protein ACNOYE_05000 [Nannocystaceae bacterium ST9]